MIAKQLMTTAIVFALGCALVLGQDTVAVKVPVRAQDAIPVLINGQFGPREWDGGQVVKVEDRLLLNFMQDRHCLYLGIRFLREMHTGIDLHLAGFGGTPKMLHVSSVLGEAEYAGGVWGDIQWGKNALWAANSIGLISEEGEQKTVPLEGFEFQLSKTLLAGQTWRLYLHLKRPELKFPKDASGDNTATWLEIEM